MLLIRFINNLTIIDETVMKLDIVNKANFRSRNLNFTWYAENMTDRELILKLKFFEPRSISIYTVFFLSSNLILLGER